VSHQAGEVEIGRDAAFALFPEYRIFSVHEGSFVEFDGQNGRWNEVTYATIMAATPIAAAYIRPRDRAADRSVVGGNVPP
jgi:hypothetical protein